MRGENAGNEGFSLGCVSWRLKNNQPVKVIRLLREWTDSTPNWG